jgi:hypothetical protein
MPLDISRITPWQARVFRLDMWHALIAGVFLDDATRESYRDMIEQINTQGEFNLSAKKPSESHIPDSCYRVND